MTYRSGYGRSTYGSYNYGLDGAIIGAASIIAVTSATAAASVRVRGAASIIETVTTTASAADRVLPSRQAGLRPARLSLLDLPRLQRLPALRLRLSAYTLAPLPYLLRRLLLRLV